MDATSSQTADYQAATMVLTRSVKTKTQTPPSVKCLFLTLPPELRVRIYHLLIHTNSKRFIFVSGIGVSKVGSDQISKKNIPTSFMFACQQIKDEILTLYCKLNAFQFIALPSGFHGLTQALKLKQICPWWLNDHIAAMRHVRIWVDAFHYFEIDLRKGLGAAIVHSLRVDIFMTSPWASQDFTHNLASAMHRLLHGAAREAEARGAESVLNAKILEELLKVTEELRRVPRMKPSAEQLSQGQTNSKRGTEDWFS